MSKTYLLLKATVTKQITVPQYTRADGTIVPAHTKTVHYDPDKSMHDVIHGNGTSSQKQAHKKLSSNPEKWNQLSDEDKHAHILSSATNIQVKKTFNGNVAKFKKSILEGKVPQAGHYNAVMSDEMGADKREKLLNELKAKVGEEKVNSLMQQASKKAEGKESGKKVAQAKHNAHAHKKAESLKKIEEEHKAKQAQQKQQSKMSSSLMEHLENENFKSGFKAVLNKFLAENDFESKSDEEKIKLLEAFTAKTAHTSPNQSLHLQDFIDSLKKQASPEQKPEKKEPEQKQEPEKKEQEKSEPKKDDILNEQLNDKSGSEQLNSFKNFFKDVLEGKYSGKYGDLYKDKLLQESEKVGQILSSNESEKKKASQLMNIFVNLLQFDSPFKKDFLNHISQIKDANEENKNSDEPKNNNDYLSTHKIPEAEVKPKTPSEEDFANIEKHMKSYASNTLASYSGTHATIAEYKANDFAVASVEGALFKQLCEIAFDDDYAWKIDWNKSGKKVKIFSPEKLSGEHKKAYDAVQKIKNGANIYETSAEFYGVDVATAMIYATNTHAHEVSGYNKKMDRRLGKAVKELLGAYSSSKSIKTGDVWIKDFDFNDEKLKSIKGIHLLEAGYTGKNYVDWGYNLSKGEIKIFKNNSGVPLKVLKTEIVKPIENYIKEKLQNGGMAQAVEKANYHYASKDVAMQSSSFPKDGPKEGDTKTVDGHTYVLQNGRWHLVSKENKDTEVSKVSHEQFMQSLPKHVKDGLENHKYGLIDEEALKEFGQEGISKLDLFINKIKEHKEKAKQGKLTLEQNNLAISTIADIAKTYAEKMGVSVQHFNSFIDDIVNAEQKQNSSDENNGNEDSQQFFDSLPKSVKDKLDTSYHYNFSKKDIEKLTPEQLKFFKDTLEDKKVVDSFFWKINQQKQIADWLGVENNEYFSSLFTQYQDAQKNKEEPNEKAVPAEIKSFDDIGSVIGKGDFSDYVKNLFKDYNSHYFQDNFVSDLHKRVDFLHGLLKHFENKEPSNDEEKLISVLKDSVKPELHKTGFAPATKANESDDNKIAILKEILRNAFRYKYGTDGSKSLFKNMGEIVSVLDGDGSVHSKISTIKKFFHGEVANDISVLLKKQTLGVKLLNERIDTFYSFISSKDAEGLKKLVSSLDYMKKPLWKKIDAIREFFKGNKYEPIVKINMDSLPDHEPSKTKPKTIKELELKIKGGLYGEYVKKVCVGLWGDMSKFTYAHDPRHKMQLIVNSFKVKEPPEDLMKDVHDILDGKILESDLADIVNGMKNGHFGEDAYHLWSLNHHILWDKVHNPSYSKENKLEFVKKLADKIGENAISDAIADIENGGHPFYNEETGKSDDGPKEGDTKVINGVTYVLQDGRWHKAGNDIKKEEFKAKPGQTDASACHDAIVQHVKNVKNVSTGYTKALNEAIKTADSFSFASPLWKARMVAMAGEEYYDKWPASQSETESVLKLWDIYAEGMEKSGMKGLFESSHDEPDVIKKMKDTLAGAMKSGGYDFMDQIFIYNNAGEIKDILNSNKTPHQKLMAVKKMLKNEPSTQYGDLLEKLNGIKAEKTAKKSELTEEGKKQLFNSIISDAKEGKYGEHVKTVLAYPSTATVFDGFDGESLDTQVAMVKNLISLKDSKDFVDALKQVSNFKVKKEGTSHLFPQTFDELMTNLKQGFYGKNTYHHVTYNGHHNYYKNNANQTIEKISKLESVAQFYATGKGGEELLQAIKNLKETHYKKMHLDTLSVDMVKGWLNSAGYSQLKNAVNNSEGGVEWLKNVLGSLNGKGETQVDLISSYLGVKKNIVKSFIDEIKKHVVKVYGAKETGKGESDDGPHEGDTKQGKTGLLQLINGHWVLVNKHDALSKFADMIIDGKWGAEFEEEANNITDSKKVSWYGDDDDAQQDAEKIFDAIKQKINEPKYKEIAEHLAEFSPNIQDELNSDTIITVDEPDEPSNYKSIASKDDNVPEVTIGSLLEDDDVNASSWKQVGGQAGSNEGGLFEDKKGQKWYCKFPKDVNHAHSEVLAGQLYKACGIPVAETKIIKMNGKVGIASKFIDNLSVDKNGVGSMAGAKEGFAVDAWLGNWDAVGLGFDNLLSDGNGSAVRIDVGGALEYRAQGAKKGADFGNEVKEMETLLDSSKNAQTAHVFKGMSEEEVHNSVKNVLKLSDSSIENLVNSYAGGSEKEKKALIDKLIARKNHLAEMFPSVADEFKPKQVISLPEPPDFEEKKISGKAWKNQQNTEVCKKIYDAFKKDGVDGIKDVTFDETDPETGEVLKKEVPISKHPSKHVKQYQDALIHASKNPKTIAPTGIVNVLGKAYGTIFDKINKLFKKVGFIKEAVKEIGRYAVLGRIVGANLTDNLKFPKHDKTAQKALRKTMYEKSWEAFQKLSSSEKTAIRDYTGSDYASLNSNVLADNLGGAEKSLLSGMEKACVEIPEGFKLSRRIDFDDEALNKLLGLAGNDDATGLILQDMNGAISTSMRTTFWSGNVQLKITCAKGCKGLYVASAPSGVDSQGSISKHPGEDEILMPHSTRFYVQKVHRTDSVDFQKNHAEDEYGTWGTKENWVVEVIALPA